MNHIFISLHLTDENDTDTVFNILSVYLGKLTIVHAFILILTISMLDSKIVVLMSKSDTS